MAMVEDHTLFLLNIQSKREDQASNEKMPTKYSISSYCILLLIYNDCWFENAVEFQAQDN